MLSESDQDALRAAYNLWPERLTGYGHSGPEPAYTLGLEDIGRRTLTRIKADALDVQESRDFPVAVASWKMPHYRDQYVRLVASNTDQCIQCGRCHVVCEDTSHQAITAIKDGRRHFEVKEEDCVGCNLCVSVCPVPDCITMRDLVPGEIDKRTGEPVPAEFQDWTTHANNPMRVTAEA